MLEAVMDMSILLVVFIGVLALAYITTKKLADIKQGGVGQKNLQTVEVLPLAGGQYLYIIRIGESYHLFSGTKENVRHCFEIDSETLNIGKTAGAPFDEYLNKFIKYKKEKEYEGN